MSTRKPRVYVASLAMYSSGYLHGAWIDLSPDEEEMQRQIDTMLRTGIIQGGEWAIHDSDIPGLSSLPEYYTVEQLVQLATLLEEHGALFALALDEYGGNIEDAIQMMERYAGAYPSKEHYMEECYGEALDATPKEVRPYVDLERWFDDIILNGAKCFEIYDETTYETIYHIFD